MDILHQLEIAWILMIQSISGWAAEPMRLISMLGQEEFFMFVMPALYWSLDAWLGVRLAMMILISHGINMVAKVIFFSPRPYWINPQIKAYAAETSFGVPSGHAQNAMSIWGLLATAVRERWVRIVLVILIVLIGLSRIILGMHFISDVLVGWVLGGLVLWGYLKLEKPVVGWLRLRSLSEMLGLILVSSVIFIAVILLTTAAFGNGQIPAVWVQNAIQAQPVGSAINPLEINDVFTLSGTWFGLLVGVAWLYHRQGGFNAAGMPGQRLLRYIIGAVGIFVLYYGLGKIFPRSPDVISYSLRFLRYTLIGLWISALAPFVFDRLGLVKAQSKEIAPLSVP